QHHEEEPDRGHQRVRRRSWHEIVRSLSFGNRCRHVVLLESVTELLRKKSSRTRGHQSAAPLFTTQRTSHTSTSTNTSAPIRPARMIWRGLMCATSCAWSDPRRTPKNPQATALMVCHK